MAQTFRKWHKINQICENGGERKIFPSANPAEVIQDSGKKFQVVTVLGKNEF